MRRITPVLISFLAAGTLSAQAPKPDAAITAATVANYATSELSTPQSTYWEGEVFPITHTLSVTKGAFQSLGGAYDWAAGAFNAEDWSLAASKDRGDRTILTQTTRAYVSKSGAISLPAGKQALVLVTRVVANNFGSEKEMETFILTSQAPNLTFRPLPAPAPGAFAGAVGEFELKSSVTASSVKVGEALTWTLHLSGNGNWPEIRALPPRAVSKDFDYITPVMKRNFATSVIFEGEVFEDLLLVPTKVGTYELGPVRFVYFNPKENKYQMLTSETVTVTVVSAGGAFGAGATPTGMASNEKVPVPAAPPPLPLDPLPAGALGQAPFSRPALLIACAVMPVLFFLYWGWLAARRRWRTDVLAPRRDARNQIIQVISRIEAEETVLSLNNLRSALFEWQRATATLVGVAHSMPTPNQIARAAEVTRPDTKGDRWAHLWRDSNQVIFGQATAVPATWTKRARDAVAAMPLPGVPLPALLRRRNLFPALALVALVMLLPATIRADAGADAYRAGDFPAAEKIWSASSAAQPTDAALRYNLSLATAQQDRWSESATQALASFCLDPSAAAVRWQFKLSLDRSGIDHPQLTALANGAGLYGIARLFSPAVWGQLALAFSAILALALGFGAFATYQGRPRAQRRASYAVAAFAALICGAALASHFCYGQLADRDIVVVARPTLLASVPTEADTGQKTSPLPAGSLAKVDRQFLTWSHLTFSNGQTGWVQTKLLTALYR